MYWEYYLLGIILLPGIIFSIVMQSRVQSTYKKYSQVLGAKGLTGAEVVKRILDVNGISDVEVRSIAGDLSDNYNPKTKVISLSNSVYNGTTIADLGVAAHECGHAVQHAKNYFPAKLRNVLAVAGNITSKLFWPIIIIGLILDFGYAMTAGKVVLFAGVAVFGLSLLFSLCTLPVELDASNRAIESLVQVGALDAMEVKGARQVLNAAAWTYIAAILMSILELLRFVLAFVISSKRDD